MKITKPTSKYGPSEARGKKYQLDNGKMYTYIGIHALIRRKYGIAYRCENIRCKGTSKRFEWANISGEYGNIRRDNWLQLCSSCHKHFDTTPYQREKARERMTGNQWATKPIYKYSKEGHLLSRYESITDAAIDTKILITSINNNLKGRSLSAGGYVWKYTKKTS